jgi:uncharacterized hydrophobic protein (TIGR00271 family)
MFASHRSETGGIRLKAFDILSDILQYNRFTPENLHDLEKKLFFEGDRRRPYLVRFTVLLFLSTIIASGGILTDSTATVIGAMIVAPLMTPILATTAALVMGRTKRAYQSGLTVLSGIIMVVILGWLIGTLSVVVISFESNSQITARIAPNIIDLVVALAAGAAGAFAFSRDDVADSLPGVAIAIALVPPLCVVGISLSQGQWEAAIGSSLLFLTNLLSILLAGGAVFALLRLGPAAIEGQDLTREAQRKAYTYIAIGVLLVAIPLAITSYRVARDSLLQLQIINAAEGWLAESDTDVKLDQVHVFDRDVQIIVRGASDPPSATEFGQELERLFPKMEDANLDIRFSKEIQIPRSGAE